MKGVEGESLEGRSHEKKQREGLERGRSKGTKTRIQRDEGSKGRFP